MASGGGLDTLKGGIGHWWNVPGMNPLQWTWTKSLCLSNDMEKKHQDTSHVFAFKWRGALRHSDVVVRTHNCRLHYFNCLIILATTHDEVWFVNVRSFAYAGLDYRSIAMWINVEGPYLRLRICIASCAIVSASLGLSRRIVSAARNFSNASPAR